MKAYLEFDLEDEFDRVKFEVTKNASGMECALTEIYEKVFRARIKYGDLEEAFYTLVEEMKAEFFAILDSFNVKI